MNAVIIGLLIVLVVASCLNADWQERWFKELQSRLDRIEKKLDELKEREK